MSLHPRDLRTDTVYRRGDLLRRGMHRRDLASDAMRRVFPGWWVRDDARVTLEELIPVFQQRVRPGAVVSHETAAELYGFPLPTSLTWAGGAPIHCRGPRDAARTSGRLVVAHPESAAPAFSHRGVAMSSPLVAIRDIAPRLSRTGLVVCLDALAADDFGTHGRLRLSEIEERVAVMQGLGVPALRHALPYVRERSWSPMETKLRLRMLSHGFPEPALNVEVVEEATGARFYIDLAYPDEMIAIEYDSEAHRKNRQIWQADLNKNEVLHDAGWKVIRASIADYRHPRDFFIRVEDALRRRRSAPTPAE